MPIVEQFDCEIRTENSVSFLYVNDDRIMLNDYNKKSLRTILNPSSNKYNRFSVGITTVVLTAANKEKLRTVLAPFIPDFKKEEST